MRVKSVGLLLILIIGSLLDSVCLALEELNDEELSQQTGQAIRLSEFTSEQLPIDLVGVDYTSH